MPPIMPHKDKNFSFRFWKVMTSHEDDLFCEHLFHF